MLCQIGSRNRSGTGSEMVSSTSTRIQVSNHLACHWKRIRFRVRMTGMDLQRTREGRSGRECVRRRREKHTEGEGDIHTYTERGSGGAQAAEGLGEGVALAGSGGGAVWSHACDHQAHIFLPCRALRRGQNDALHRYTQPGAPRGSDAARGPGTGGVTRDGKG